MAPSVYPAGLPLVDQCGTLADQVAVRRRAGGRARVRVWKTLQETKRRVLARDASLGPALAWLRAEAQQALKAGPFSVVTKTATPPSGDRHDCMSQAPYFWPNPSTPDGLAYVRRDEALLAWFRDYLRWLRESGHGRDEAAARNNHGTHYDAQVASFALFTGQFTGQPELAARVLSESRQKRIAARRGVDLHFRERTVPRNAIACLSLALGAALAAVSFVEVRAEAEGGQPVGDIRFITLDPGHFHAALVQKEMYAGVSRKVHVFAPVGPEVIDHLGRVVCFNLRKDNPTGWELEVHTGPDFLERMLRERPGNAVVISGRNRGKIDRIQSSLDAGLHALVDKPWILEAPDLPKLERALDTADKQGLVALDIMTERFEVTTQLQRELVRDAATFGSLLPGSEAEPAVYMESVHYLMKMVAGAPNIRPVWFFETEEQGEGLNDIGTHLVDLAQWTLFPDQALDYWKDVRLLRAQRWPTLIPRAEFRRVTRVDFPASLAARVKGESLEYFCNTLVSYTLRGAHVTLNVIWDWEAPPGAGDSHFAYYRGSRAKVEVRQGVAEQHRPELYVVPSAAGDKTAVLAAVRKKIAGLQPEYPGTDVVEQGRELRITIPDRLRVGHEEHFAQVTQRFLRYLRDRSTLPAWERPNMLAKYYVTTEGTLLARRSAPQAAERRAPK